MWGLNQEGFGQDRDQAIAKGSEEHEEEGKPLEDVGLGIRVALEIQRVNAREDETEASKNGSWHVILGAATWVPIPHREFIDYKA